MSQQASNTRKRVPLTEIKPGMYVVSLDRSWLQTRFIFHQRVIQNVQEIEQLKKNGIREVVIDTARGADVKTDRGSEDQGHVTKQSEEAGFASTSKLAPRSPPPAEIRLRPLIKELEAARTIHDEALATVQSIFEGVRGGSALNSQAAKQTVTNLIGTITRSTEANLLLMQMRRFQRDLFTHAMNVCVLSLVVSTLEEIEVDAPAFGMGALLHDIGETRIPRNLLRKKEEFTEPERRLVEQHPKLGAMLLEQSGEVPPLARQIVLEHHENIDGSGYPNRVRGADVSLFSQIVAITDTYDYLLSGRGQGFLQPSEAVRQLFLQSNAGTLDRGLVERVIRCLGVYPIGSLVELNTGERGIVVAANRADTLRPIVRIITSRIGATVPNGPLISLADGGAGAPDRRIIGALDPGKERINPMAFLRWSPPTAG